MLRQLLGNVFLDDRTRQPFQRFRRQMRKRMLAGRQQVLAQKIAAGPFYVRICNLNRQEPASHGRMFQQPPGDLRQFAFFLSPKFRA